MQLGSANSGRDPYPSRSYAPLYTEGSYDRREETQDPLTAMQPAVSAVSNDFSDASLSFAPHEPLIHPAPAWYTDNLCSNVGGAYSAGPSIPYGQHVPESSEQHNNTYPVYQPGRHNPDVGFDLISFEMPPRTQTQAQAPISSADFNSTTLPLIFEDTISDPLFSPTCSRSSQSSFNSTWSSTRNIIPQMSSHAEIGLGTQSASSSTQPTSTSHLLPDNSSTKPYRCTQPGCSRSYARKFELYRHQRRYTEVKSYYCQVPGCDKGFYRKDHLKQHMRQVHGT